MFNVKKKPGGLLKLTRKLFLARFICRTDGQKRKKQQRKMLLDFLFTITCSICQ